LLLSDIMNDKTTHKPFFFIQISDPQFGMTTANKDFIAETRLLENALGHINRLKPAFVILTGDIVNEPADDAQADEAMRVLAQLNNNIPLYMLPGNHDIADHPVIEYIDWYQRRFGPDHYSFDLNHWHFVVLNSQIVYYGENLTQLVREQLLWLRDDLQKAQSQFADRIIVFMHHPLFLENADQEDQYFVIPQKSRKIYLELFEQFGVQKVFNGHLHQNNIACDHNIEIVTTGPVGMPLGQAVSGFRIVKIHDDTICHEYYPLDQVPQSVDIS